MFRSNTTVEKKECPVSDELFVHQCMIQNLQQEVGQLRCAMVDMCKKYARLHVMPRTVPVSEWIDLSEGSTQTAVIRYGAKFNHIPMVFVEPLAGVSIQTVHKSTTEVRLKIESEISGRVEISVLAIAVDTAI